MFHNDLLILDNAKVDENRDFIAFPLFVLSKAVTLSPFTAKNANLRKKSRLGVH